MTTDHKTIAQDIQAYNPGDLVELFILDASLYGLSLMYFCSSIYNNGNSIVFNGHTYAPLSMQAEGFQRNSQGGMPTPSITIADVTNAIPTQIRIHNDLLGTKITRIRTFARYLDGKTDANPSAEFPREVYWVERKENQNRFMIKLSLSPIISMHGLTLPRRLILKNVCRWVYRTWNGTAFVGSSSVNACPYAGDLLFKKDGTSTVVSSEDECGHKFSDCLLRYPQPNPVPFGGFPGVSRVSR